MALRSLLVFLTAVGVAALSGLLAAPTAQAHEFEPERQVLVQVFPEHLDIVIFYTEAPGPRSNLFLTQFGLHHDMSGPLAAMASRAVLSRVLDGLQFEVEGETPRTGTPEVRLRNENGRLMAAAFVRYDLDPLPEGASRSVVVRAMDRSFLPTPARIYAGEGLQRAGEGSDVDSVVLHRNHESRAVFEYR